MRHENICKTTKKRRIFDSSKQRTEGLEKVKVQTPSSVSKKVGIGSQSKKVSDKILNCF